MARFMVATELAQRSLIQYTQNFAELFGFRVTGRKPPPVNLAQGPDQCIAVLVADFAILVAMSIVGIRHCFSPASLCSGEQHLRNRTGWQLPFAVLSRTRPYKKRAPYL